MENEIILSGNGLCVSFKRRDDAGRFNAVDQVDFALRAGEALGVVGESGSGKTTLARAVVGLQPLSSGRILFRREDMAQFDVKAQSRFRQQVQMVFQDVSGALNPRHRIGRILGEVLKVNAGVKSASDRDARVEALLDRVGLTAETASAFPHELSGGQRQRVGLARALAVEPAVIVADEPVSALDVSVQAQILDLMRTLQRELGVAYLFIAHDLAVVKQVCDRVLVMNTGRVVEEGTAAAVLNAPTHAYTRSLLDAVPDVDRGLARSAVEPEASAPQR